MQPVILQLRVCQKYPDQSPDTIRQQARGMLKALQRGYILDYDEPGEGMEGVHNRIYLLPSQVILKRSGALSSEMCFSPGKYTAFSYAIAPGTLDMKVFTRSLHWDISGGTGNLDISYQLILPDGQCVEIDYHLKIHPATSDS